MGNIIDSVPCTLTPADMERLAALTVFNPVEIRAVWYYYHYLNNQHEKITKSQFQDAILFRDSILLDGIFKAFDFDNDGSIDFNEYILCLSTVSSKAPADDKLKLSFKIYDLDGDGMISTKDLTKVVGDTMGEQDVVIHKVDVEQIVEQTMKEANPKRPGYISYEEYLDLVVDRPYLLSHLTLNISSIISEYTSKTGHAFKSPRPL